MLHRYTFQSIAQPDYIFTAGRAGLAWSGSVEVAQNGFYVFYSFFRFFYGICQNLTADVGIAFTFTLR